jgi:hypothetical protein
MVCTKASLPLSLNVTPWYRIEVAVTQRRWNISAYCMRSASISDDLARHGSPLAYWIGNWMGCGLDVMAKRKENWSFSKQTPIYLARYSNFTRSAIYKQSLSKWIYKCTVQGPPVWSQRPINKAACSAIVERCGGRQITYQWQALDEQ